MTSRPLVQFSTEYPTTALLLLLATSIHDIHLTPTIHPVPLYEAVKPLPRAKRLVLIVADGLRADIALTGFKDANSKKLMPNLYNITKNPAKSAVVTSSLADAPTESRPNHVVMLAGFPEELSNVYNNWKENGRDFDHLLRRASQAYAFGGPDVVDFFAGSTGKGASTVHIESFPYYLYHTEDYAGELDRWTVRKYQSLLFNTGDKLRTDGLVVFLHLAGIDTNGHRYGALSREYRENAALVDELVAEIETATRNFFGDDQTLFIFTSDHGFPDVGGHGSADIHARTCPFVAWGVDALPKDVNLASAQQEQLRQGQISGFASAILGLATPSNSIHSMPVNLYVGSERQVAAALLANYGQLISEMCKQQEALAAVSPLGGLLSSPICGLEKRRLAKLEEQMRLEAFDNVSEIVAQNFDWIGSLRFMIIAMRGVLAGVPFILACFVGFMMRVPDKLITPTPSRSLIALILASVVSIAWWLVGFRSLTGLLLCAMSLMLLFVGTVELGTDRGRGDRLLSFVFAMVIGLLFWSNKFYLAVLVVCSAVLWEQGAVNSAKFALLGLALVLCSTSLLPSLPREIICILGLTATLGQLCAHMGRDHTDHGALLKALPIAVGVYLKAGLVLSHFLPSLARLLSLGYVCLYGVFTAWVCRSLAQRPGTASLLWIVIMSFALLLTASLIDPILCYSITLVILFWKMRESMASAPYRALGTVTRKVSTHYELLLSLILVCLGPRSLADIAGPQGYALGILGVAFGLDRFVQVPMAAVIGVLLFSYFLRINRETIDDLPDTLSSTSALSLRISSVILLCSMCLLPHKESWLEIGTGIAKVFIAASIPLMTSLCTTAISVITTANLGKH